MYPEAGGSSSFARRAFNEFWSFFAAWAQMLNYVDHDRHLGVLRAALHRRAVLGARCATGPATSSSGVVVALLAAINVVGVKESAGVNVLLAVIDFVTQLLLVVVGVVLVFSPEDLVDNVHLGVAPTWKDFFLAIPVGMIAYTGIETISNMAEEARTRRRRSRPRSTASDRRVRHLLRAARGRAVRAAGRRRTPTATTRRCSA